MLTGGIRRDNGLLALAGPSDHDRRRRGLPLANLVHKKLHPKNITAINHCIQLHDVEVILRLYVLIDIKVGVAVVRPVVPNLWVLKALFL